MVARSAQGAGIRTLTPHASASNLHPAAGVERGDPGVNSICGKDEWVERPHSRRIESGVNRVPVNAGSIAARWEDLQDRVASVCARIDRDPAGIRIVAVSKQHPATLVHEAIAAGITHFGENRVQEAQAKIALVTPRPVWHLVGHLQTNKAKVAAGLFDWVHSVDSAKVALALGSGAGQAGRVLEVLVQVNTTGEAQKSGCSPEELEGVIEAVLGRPGLALRGLMTIGPESQDETRTRRAFEEAARCADLWRARLGGGEMDMLSMGMSDDWPWALEYGANMIRVGTALFGPRSKGQA